jgi:hypothetical protein
VKTLGRIAKWTLIATLVAVCILVAESLLTYVARNQESALAFAQEGFESELRTRNLQSVDFKKPKLQNETVWSYTFVWEGSKRNDAILVSVLYLPRYYESWYVQLYRVDTQR